MKATVTNTPNGERSYFVAYPLPDQGLDVEESITFTANDWKSGDDILPKNGQVVVLRRITQFRRGWRAQSASPVELQESDSELAETTME
ncbi:MAG: hypothetical protein QG551_112 [Patescibacteria group bacterium]|nr:hypothetical protein [Patescibacteria group bacterium]